VPNKQLHGDMDKYTTRFVLDVYNWLVTGVKTQTNQWHCSRLCLCFNWQNPKVIHPMDTHSWRDKQIEAEESVHQTDLWQSSHWSDRPAA